MSAPIAKTQKPWTPEEEHKLERLWGEKNIDALAAELGHTACAVWLRAQKLKLGPARRGLTSLKAFIASSGYAKSRILIAAQHLGIVFAVGPRVTPRPMKLHRHGRKTFGRWTVVSEEQQERLLAYLASVPDGVRLLPTNGSKTAASSWGTGKKPPACLGCDRTDRPHRGRGRCKPCLSKVYYQEDKAVDAACAAVEAQA